MEIAGAKRLTFVEQVSRNKKFRGRPLAIEIKGPKNTETRAVDAIRNLPVLLAIKGVKVRAYTPLGAELKVESLIGKTAEQIDLMADRVDKLFREALRKPQIELLKRLDGGQLNGTEYLIWTETEGKNLPPGHYVLCPLANDDKYSPPGFRFLFLAGHLIENK